MTKNLYQKLPETPGVYLFKNARGKILYIGKAGNLRRRVSSYFLRPHDLRIQKLVSEIRRIDYKKTESALEALILESSLIKKFQPTFNIREKDDRSFLYIEITKEDFPRVLLVRGKSRARGRRFGPFASASHLREALRMIRRIFPWSVHPSESIGKFARPCFDYELGLCPGTCIGAIAKREYARNIKNLKLFFEGKKRKLFNTLEREMEFASRRLDFEKAEKLKKQIFSLRHIQDAALIKDELGIMNYESRKNFRIEGYDVSNILGDSAVGSMVVFVDGNPRRNEYKKFKIRTITQSDDVGMLTEILRRRFSHASPAGGWPLPDLVLVDGGKGQVNAAKRVLYEAGMDIPVLGIAKGPDRKKNELVGTVPKWTDVKVLIRVRDEAHRFAIGYHRILRRRMMVR